ncbi:MAG: mannose-1-phosphate guanylyltransferase/mannose-6-phosphate isomerase [Nitrospina sp.]|nr:mannose-1-phosphate guanylyltransferase/mannose-6-phosphate isomerase [Nitrospina sp.]
MHAVIIAGGSGTRFWPKSRENLPKQLLSIVGQETMIQNTVDRISPIIPVKNTWVITNEQHAFETCSQLKNLGFSPSQLLTEPIPRNTSAAIGYSAKILSRNNPEAIMAIFPADHVITTTEPFLKLLKQAEAIANENHLVTIGIKPTSPEAGYGYIKQGKLITGNSFKVDRFIEKPDKLTAENFLKEGGYYWNSGIFVWKVSTLLNEISLYLPKLHEQLEGLSINTTPIKGKYPYQKLSKPGAEIFNSLESISIDHGVMEKSNKVAVLPANIEWNDVGTWTSLAAISKNDPHRNVISGNVVSIENSDSIIQAEDRLVAALGLKNIILVDTPDALLVCAKERAQDIKKIVEKIKSEKRPEVNTTISETRPWGNYTVLLKETNYLVKRIVVLPGESLSLQSHKHRSEHWTVVSGVAQVQIGEISQTLNANQFVEIPKGAKHRLANRNETALIIIEVQLGDKLEEDDIIRHEDKYGRDD